MDKATCKSCGARVQHISAGAIEDALANPDPAFKGHAGYFQAAKAAGGWIHHGANAVKDHHAAPADSRTAEEEGARVTESTNAARPYGRPSINDQHDVLHPEQFPK